MVLTTPIGYLVDMGIGIGIVLVLLGIAVIGGAVGGGPVVGVLLVVAGAGVLLVTLALNPRRSRHEDSLIGHSNPGGDV